MNNNIHGRFLGLLGPVRLVLCFAKLLMIPRTVNHVRIAIGPILGLQASSPILSCTYDAYSRSQHARKLASQHPDFAPATRLLQHWAQESASYEEVAAICNPHKSDLLAFGEVPVVSQNNTSTATVPVAAVVSGLGGDVVRLVRLNRDHVSWQGNLKTELEWSTFERGIELSWVGHDGPIQQLCFAPATWRERAWLAVRYYTKLALISLLVTEEGLLVSSTPPFCQRYDYRSRHGSLSRSSLELPFSRTGGSPLTDMAFNPWRNQQLAVIDEGGHWSVWSIDIDPHRNEMWEVTEVTNGNVPGEPTEDNDPVRGVNGGWGRIIWLGDANTVAVAYRHRIAAFSIDGPSRRLKVPDLGLAQAKDQIFDLKTSSSDRDQAFVLTSTRILLLRLRRQGDQQLQSTILIQLSWKHFNDPRDLGLKLSVAEDFPCKPESRCLMGDLLNPLQCLDC